MASRSDTTRPQTASLRAAYPGTARGGYLNTAALGLPAAAATEATIALLRLLELDPEGAQRGPTLAAARVSAAQLVNAAPEQIALTPSTTLALLATADAVPVGEGDNVVTCDLEFMSVIAPWLEKCRAVRAELRIVPHDRGRVEAERVVNAIDERTRAVVLSAVQWTTGFRLDLASISAACASRNVPLIVDAIQQLGALQFDVRATPVSVLCAGGHKWLGCPSAYGFLYVDDGFARRFRPTLTYAPTSMPPGGDWRAAWSDPAYDPVTEYLPAPNASRFELGIHHGVAGAAALDGALGVLLAVEGVALERHVLALAERVADGAEALGLSVVSDRRSEHRSGITTLRAGTDAGDDLDAVAFLASHGIAVSARYTSGAGGIRVSTHVYNDESDVDGLLATLEQWIRRRRCR